MNDYQNIKDLLEAKINPIHESIVRIELTFKEELLKLNGQVSKNTEFRKKAKIYGGIIVLFLTFLSPILQDAVRAFVRSLTQGI